MYGLNYINFIKQYNDTLALVKEQISLIDPNNPGSPLKVQLLADRIKFFEEVAGKALKLNKDMWAKEFELRERLWATVTNSSSSQRQGEA